MFEVGKCRLKILLKERNISQVEFARKVGMPKQQITDYATGNTASMSLKNAKTIAHALGCHIDDLYEWVPISKK